MDHPAHRVSDFLEESVFWIILLPPKSEATILFLTSYKELSESPFIQRIKNVANWKDREYLKRTTRLSILHRVQFFAKCPKFMPLLQLPYNQESLSKPECFNLPQLLQTSLVH